MQLVPHNPELDAHLVLRSKANLAVGAILCCLAYVALTVRYVATNHVHIDPKASELKHLFPSDSWMGAWPLLVMT